MDDWFADDGAALPEEFAARIKAELAARIREGTAA